jgi:hypothetical protein
LIRNQQSARAYSDVREAAAEVAKQVPGLSAEKLAEAIQRMLDQEVPARAAAE